MEKKEEGNEPSPQEELEKKAKAFYFDIHSEPERISEVPPEFHRAVAQEYIKDGEAPELAEHIDKFQVDHREIAEALIEAKCGWAVLIYPDKFQGIDLMEVIDRLIARGEGRDVVEFAGKLKGLDGRDIIRKLITANQGHSLAWHIEDFDVDRKEVALELIAQGQGTEIAENLDKFPDHRDLAVAMIDNEQGAFVAEHFENFKELNPQEIATRLINAGGSQWLAENLRKFPHLSRETAMTLIEQHCGEWVTGYRSQFDNLPSADLIQKLIQEKQGFVVARQISQFSDLEQEEVVKTLLQAQSSEDLKGAVVQNLDKLKAGALGKDIVLEFIKAGYIHPIVLYLSIFRDLDNEVATELCNANVGHLVAHRLPVFKGVNHQELADRLVAEGRINEVMANLPNFQDIDHEKLVEKEVADGKGYSVILMIEKLRVDNQQLALRLVRAGKGYELIDKLDTFRDIDRKAIADYLVETGQGAALTLSLSKFPEVDQRELARTLLARKEGETLVNSVHYFDPNSLDNGIAMELLAQGRGRVVAEAAELFEGLDQQKVVETLIEQEHGDAIAYNLGHFSVLAQNRALGERLMGSLKTHIGENEDFRLMARVNSFYHPPLDRIMTKTVEIFGEYATRDLYENIEVLLQGSIPDHLRAVGVTETGTGGVRQLTEKLRQFKHHMLEESFDPSVVLSSPILEGYFAHCVRLEESDWGDHDNYTLRETIKDYVRLKEARVLKPLPGSYVAAEARVAKVDREKQGQFKYSEQFRSRYGLLLDSLETARRQVGNRKVLSTIAETIDKRRMDIIGELENKLATTEQEKAREGLQGKIDVLTGVNVRSVQDFQRNFTILAEYRELHPMLRELVFYFAFQKNRTYVNESLGNYSKDRPTVEQIAWVINFVDHITNQETMSQYFESTAAMKAFKGITSIRALEEEVARAQNQATKGTAEFKFLPTRGILAEFSGHIADACWASQYASMLQDFPNFVPVIMIQNPGTKDERLAGGCLLIEAQDTDRNPLLIIRGLNPQENIINQLSVSDFYEKFINYVKSLGKTTGRKVAIVIDDHSGGAATNRPVLFQHLNGLKHNLNRAQLSSLSKIMEVTFNGYDISDDCYLV